MSQEMHGEIQWDISRNCSVAFAFLTSALPPHPYEDTTQARLVFRGVKVSTVTKYWLLTKQLSH